MQPKLLTGGNPAVMTVTIGMVLGLTVPLKTPLVNREEDVEKIMNMGQVA